MSASHSNVPAMPVDVASQHTPSARASRRRTVLIAIGAALLLVAVVFGVRWWLYGRFIESTDDAYIQADSVTVAPKVSGYVAEVYVRDNQQVTAGQELVRLDNRQYQAAFDEAQANVASRQADVARADADLQQQKARIAQAAAEVDGARANARYAASQVERYAPLVRTGAETEERTAELRNAQTRASTTLAANEAALKVEQTQTVTLQTRLQQARAQLEVAEASARKAKLDLEDTIVRATTAGRVADKGVRVGQFAQPGTRLLTVVPVQDLYLTANFKETQVGRMRAGQPVTLHVDALSGEALHGVIDSLSPGTGSQFALLPAQNATGNFTKIVQRVPVRIHVDVPNAARPVLVPGLSVVVDVDTHELNPAHGPANAHAPAGAASHG
ncbi:HlyD family secretion protein [Cupriavidus sp.]|uniref:HlyD family secretion protein n=2 Tax=Cupriavidus TaxID=106589 RepID=UPI001C00412D|nr:HlyD family secretion protein [Cupriavidus sp.]QWE97610.1 HlyD family secretion protein [Cupriavidus sp. EM10]MCA3193322.1 HlyD family secretion protein [Cupriavidus sp.]MCA3200360.1 HlyD family secretion protein [Cupriavidus sp.]MCA3204434.1 HlyD family secretion protein [Cupriavidus sp.]MCA3205910.1 HlyD family secretion protein [Cupriavidus sp.]